MDEKERAHDLIQDMLALLHRMDELHRHLKSISDDARAARHRANQSGFSAEEGELQLAFTALEDAGNRMVEAHRRTVAAIDRSKDRGPHRGEGAPEPADGG